MIEFNRYESARRRGAMSDKDIEPHWNRIFGKKITRLQLRRLRELWS